MGFNPLNQLVSPFSESDKMPWGGAPKCPACDRNVYPMDQVIAADRQGPPLHYIQPTPLKMPNQTIKKFSRVYHIGTSLRLTKIATSRKKCPFTLLDSCLQHQKNRQSNRGGLNQNKWSRMCFFLF
jgi:hypothetical protein